MKPQQLIDLVMEIGSQMLISGAEISRVEDTITRICNAYGIVNTDVFTITSCIIITIKSDANTELTQTKRIKFYETNLEKVDKLNALSRYICKNKPDYEYVKEKLDGIENNTKSYPDWILVLMYAVIAASLTLFLGGDIADFCVSGIIGALMKILLNFVSGINKNSVFINMVTAFFAGILAVIFVHCNLGHNIEKIVGADLLLLISGVALTNSIRDMIGGDTMSGMLRFIEAIIGAVAVALGFVLATVYFGGMIL